MSPWLSLLALGVIVVGLFVVFKFFKNALNLPWWREVGNRRGAGSAALGPASGAPTALSALGLPAEVYLPPQGDRGHQLLLVQASSEWCSPHPHRPVLMLRAELGSLGTA